MASTCIVSTPVAVEASVDSLQVLERSDEQRGAAEQNHRQENLARRAGSEPRRKSWSWRPESAGCRRPEPTSLRVAAQRRREAEEQRLVSDRHAGGKADDPRRSKCGLEHALLSRSAAMTRDEVRHAPAREQQSDRGPSNTSTTPSVSS